MTEKSLADVPAASSSSTRERMQRQPKKDTHAELRLRSGLFRAGMRYRVHFPVPGNARRTIDIAFPRRKVAVFVDGCFWHGCPLHGRHVKTNEEWWTRKVDRNRERDRDTDALLREQGWLVVRVWEHEETQAAVDRVREAVAQSGR